MHEAMPLMAGASQGGNRGGRADRDRGTGRRRPRGAQPHGLQPRGRFLAPGWVRARIHRPRPHPRTPAIGSNALSVNHTFPCILHGASERLLPSPARPRRICAFAPPAGSNNPTRHVENCGRPARGLDSTGARSTITGGCMTAADGKCGHRFRTNLANRATRHGEAGSSTAGAIRAVRGGATSSGIAATLFYNPRKPRCSIPSHRTVTPTISTLCPALGHILADSCRKPGLEPARPPHA